MTWSLGACLLKARCRSAVLPGATPCYLVLTLMIYSRAQAQHFFKVGQQRAQGKTMLLCLAQQLAEKLAGFAPLLLTAVKELAAAGSSLPDLTLLDTYEK